MRRQEPAGPISEQRHAPVTRRNSSPGTDQRRPSRLTAMTAAFGVLLSFSGFVVARTFEEQAAVQAVSRQAEQEVRHIGVAMDGLLRDFELLGQSAAASSAPTTVIAGVGGPAQDLLPPGVASIVWYSKPAAEAIGFGRESWNDTEA